MNSRRRAAVGAAGLAAAATLAMFGPAAAAADPERASTASDALPPGGRTVYVTNSADDGGTPNVARFTINNAGTLNPVDTVDAGARARGMAFTPDLRFAYVASTTANRVDMYRIGPNGELTRFGAVETPSPLGIAIAPNGRTLYVVNAGTRMVSVFTVRPDGGLTLRQVVDTGAEATHDVALTPDGRFLYVGHGLPTDTEPGVIIGFALRPDGSVGRDVARVQIGIGGAETVITPNGRFVYVVHEITNDVYGFRIGRDGGLSPVPGSPVGGGDYTDSIVNTFTVAPDGNLRLLQTVKSQGRRPAFQSINVLPEGTQR
ncbi:MAG: beta-propeller fold lactonase family protein [Streptosporangiales bacterium]|nr:beta-propeller fold lactonase family protein [Streptosporangiales bacterium]